MDPYVGEIRIFTGNFAPKGWAWCNGASVPIRSNTALFALLGTTFGGDGVTTFALPNFQGRIPVGQGQGTNLSSYRVGQTGGEESHTLILNEMARHNHPFNADNFNADQTNPNGNLYGAYPLRTSKLYADGSNTATFANGTIQPTGGNQGHENRQSFLTLTYIIALVGVFPQRP